MLARKVPGGLRMSTPTPTSHKIKRWTLLALALSVFALPVRAATPVKVGVLTDMAGVTADITGRGSVEAARMAIEDFGGVVLGQPIELIFADHQHKADVGSAIAMRWLSVEGVDVITDVPDSAVALAVQRVVRDQNKIVMYSGAGTTALVQNQCSPNGVQWTYDTYGLARGTASAVVKSGLKTWFIMAQGNGLFFLLYLRMHFPHASSLEPDILDWIPAHPLSTTPIRAL